MPTTKTILYANTDLIPAIASGICKQFTDKGYEGYRRHLESGRIDVFISKGSVVSSFFGLDTDLHIKLSPTDEGITLIFEKDINRKGRMPAGCLIFLFWPFFPTFLWGFCKRSRMKSKVISIAHDVISRNCVETQYFLSDSGSPVKEEDNKNLGKEHII